MVELVDALLECTLWMLLRRRLRMPSTAGVKSRSLAYSTAGGRGVPLCLAISKTTLGNAFDNLFMDAGVIFDGDFRGLCLTSVSTVDIKRLDSISNPTVFGGDPVDAPMSEPPRRATGLNAVGWLPSCNVSSRWRTAAERLCARCALVRRSGSWYTQQLEIAVDVLKSLRMPPFAAGGSPILCKAPESSEYTTDGTQSSKTHEPDKLQVVLDFSSGSPATFARGCARVRRARTTAA